MAHRGAALLVAVATAAFLSPTEADAQTREVAFSTAEGTWLSLDVSPGGDRLVFELLGDIYALPIAGGAARPVLTGTAFQSQPRYSPDGAWLAFISDESGADNLWIARSDGSDARPVSDRTGSTFISPDWSVDGETLFVTVVTGAFQRVAELWAFEVADGAETRLVENGNGPSAPLVSSPAPGPYGASVAPDGSIYYTSVTPRPYGSRNGASSAVMRYDSAVGHSTPVPLEGIQAMKPRVSPDGRTLVYAAMRDGRTGLKAKDLSAGTERWIAYPIQRHQLEGRATRDVLPNYAFTPDGSALLVELRGRIQRLDLNTDEVTPVPFEAAVRLQVAERLDFPRPVETGPVRARRAHGIAAASSGRLAFSSLARIWVIEAVGSTPRRLTDEPRPREFMPAWSPDGRWIAYVTWTEEGGHLWKASAAGGVPERLSDAPALWADPVWTPDGDAVIALRASLGAAASVPSLGPGTAVPLSADLVSVPLDGGSPPTIAPSNGLRFPHFGPATDAVYLSSGAAGLVRMPLAGGPPESVATMSGAPAAELRISPDGRFVAVRAGPAVMRVQMPVAVAAGPVPIAPEGPPLTSAGATSVAWTPDGAALLWTEGPRVGRAETDGGAPPTTMPLGVEVPRAAATGSVVLSGAKIVTMRGDEVIERGDVVVTDGRISWVGPTGTRPHDDEARVIDLSGRVIVPGFIDVHAHFGARGELLEPEGTFAFSNLAFGITTVRNPQAPLDVFELADVIEADGVPAPRVVSTGPGLFGMLNLQSYEQTLALLSRYRDEYGTHVLKSYLVGDRQQRAWVAQASRELGMMPTTEGGADTKADLTHAIDGFSGNEHAVPVAPIYDDIVQLFARTGVTYTPTLVVSFGAALPIYRLLAEERPHEDARAARWHAEGELYQRSSTRQLWFAPEDFSNIEVAQGADAILAAGGNVALGGHGEVQGLSNHWEMKLLAAGGMSNHDILRVATIMGAEAVGHESDLGSIEVGKLADLVVLNRDPLTDIEATQDIDRVMRGGVLYDGFTLDEVWPTPRSRPVPWKLQKTATPATAVASIEADVREAMDRTRTPGVAVAVVHGGDVLMSKGFGLANIETGSAVTPETMFQSGSVGKQFTAAGVMVLVEDGRVDLDESIRTHLPEAPESWQPITVRHLLTHSSGIPDYTSASFDYATNYSEDDLVRMASDLTLEYPAGTRWNYSNTGYAMLGVMISRVTGVPYWDFLRERVFDPAGMPTIRINTATEIVPHRARGYMPGPGGLQNASHVAEQTNTTADGSMLFSLRDMIAWNEAVRTRTVLSPESWDQILSPMVLNSGNTHPYGFAWFFNEAAGQPVVEHGGSWQGFVNQYTRFPDQDLSVIVLTNARSTMSTPLAMRIGALVDPALTPEPPPTEAIADDPVVTAYVADMIEKMSDGSIELTDWDFVRQTVFPRMRVALQSQLDGLGRPDDLTLVARKQVGDDTEFVYRATWGDQRRRITLSIGPDGGLTNFVFIVPDTP
jgi:CubicO group peptidase (beta-lactamase class C family)/Tol biopolymer transport system component